MNNSNDEEIKLVNGQLIATFIFIISLTITLIITYNEKLQKENKKPFFTNKESINIALINRIVLLILGGYFVYDAFRRKILAEENANNKNNKFNELTSNLQITASWFAFISSVIILFIIILNYNNLNFDISGTEGDNI
ncbi:MAG: hypothetical protein IJZ77_00425 [Bacilli bacterium]|nr:hypothetical protein [Bacilli bacterium]MBQ8472764.1 hypothetical protein [Bacilli bacterium]